MSTIAKAKMDERVGRLIAAIDETIRKHTTESPMTLEQIIGTLAFMTGGAIGHVAGRNERRLARRMADANLDYGCEATSGMKQSSGLILPDRMMQ